VKWYLTDRTNSIVVIEAATAEEAVLAHVGPRESEHTASQPDPEACPECWHLHFTRPDSDGLPFRYVVGLVVRSEKEWRRRKP
jgi:hypothetical protein